MYARMYWQLWVMQAWRMGLSVMEMGQAGILMYPAEVVVEELQSTWLDRQPMAER